MTHSSLSPFEVMAAALKQSTGLSLGEKHGYYAHMEWISAHIPAFANQGVSHLFIEHFTQDSQWLLDDYWQNVPGSEARLKSHLFHNFPSDVSPVPVFDLIRASKENKIRVVGVDVLPACYSNLSFADARDAVNEAWAAKVQQIMAMQSPENKYLVVAGAAHSYLRAAASNLRPSINEWLSIPAFDFTYPQCNDCDTRYPNMVKMPEPEVTIIEPSQNTRRAHVEVGLAPSPFQNTDANGIFYPHSGGPYDYEAEYNVAQLQAYRLARQVAGPTIALSSSHTAEPIVPVHRALVCLASESTHR